MTTPSGPKLLVVATLSCWWLVQISPAAANLLHCLDDREQGECCPEDLGIPELANTGQLSNGSDCDCCVEIDALPESTGSTATHWFFVDRESTTTLLSHDVTKSSTSTASVDSRAPTISPLGSLRTIRLLI